MAFYLLFSTDEQLKLFILEQEGGIEQHEEEKEENKEDEKYESGSGKEEESEEEGSSEEATPNGHNQKNNFRKCNSILLNSINTA